MSNRLDPDQAWHFVGPDLGPKCLQKLSADNTRRLRVKALDWKPVDMNNSLLYLLQNAASDQGFHYLLTEFSIKI